MLHEQAIRKGNKKYIALVRGVWTDDQEKIVDRPLKINEVTKSAVTKFSCLATMEGENERSSLLLCEPLTGRTHQIRRHLQGIGHPIIGDSEHGDSRVNRWWREERGLDRLALHCWSIEFTLNGRPHTCVAPLLDPFRQVLQGTYLWYSALEKFSSLSAEPYDDRSGSLGRTFNNQGEV
jgi:tRNA pseudouridine65 synthase